MNKKFVGKIIAIIILISYILLNNTVLAAGTFSLNKSTATLTEGETTTFSINGSSATGRVDITSSDSSVATVSSSSVWLENSSSTITITAKKAGTATITVSGTVADAEGIEDTVTQNIVVTVKAKATTPSTPPTTDTPNTSETPSTPSTPSTPTTPTEQPKEKSKDANLSTLGVTPKDFDFSGFNKNKISYSVTVPSDVDSLKVLYKTADANATVKVTGNSGFEVGSDNEIKIVVTAEDGKTTKTYTIKVTKLAEEEEKPGNLLDDEEGLFLTSLSLENIELSPEFAKDTYSYTATLDDENVTEIEVNAKANKEDADIEISGNTDLVAGENTINIVVSSEDSTEQVVYQIVLTKVAEEEIISPNTDNNNEESGTDLIGSIKKYIGIAIAVVILMIVAVIVLLILLKRENRRLEEDDDEEEFLDKKSEEYDVYKNDVNEFENKNKNFIESLYRQRNGSLYNEEELDENEKQTLEEINRETDRIFSDKVEGQSVEYNSNEEYDENLFEERKRRRGKGKHSK